MNNFSDPNNNFSFDKEVQKDHFVKYKGKIFAGHHYLIDVWGEGEHLENEDLIKKIIANSAIAAGATVLDLHSHKFGEAEGISAIALLAESHISVHTWPERNFAAFDIFLCGNTNPEKAVRSIKQHIKFVKIKISKIKRGKVEKN